LTAGVLFAEALRLLPEHLDLFTAMVGGGGIGGIVGGLAAWMLDKDLARGGLLGGAVGVVYGIMLAVLQSSGLYS
jgi:hypothetical protein